MTTSFSNRMEAVKENNDRADAGASQALSVEAAGSQKNFNPSDVGAATQSLVDDKKLPPLQLTDGLGNIENKMNPWNGYGSLVNNGNILNSDGSAGGIANTKKERDPWADKIGDKAPDGRENDLESMNKMAEARTPEYDREIKKAAMALAESGTFGTGPDGEENRRNIEKHIKNGTLDDYVKEVNKDLAAMKSPNRVSATQLSENVQYTRDEGNKSIVPRVESERVKRADITVTNGNGVGVTQRYGQIPQRPGYSISGRAMFDLSK